MSAATREDARRFVTTAIEGSGQASADDFDVERVLDCLYERAHGCWSFDDLAPWVFWSVVARFERTAASRAAETLVRHAWDAHEQDTGCAYADHLRDAVWQLEEAVDYGRADVEQLARRVVQALSIATGDEVDDLIAPMPAVATWLGFDR